MAKRLRVDHEQVNKINNLPDDVLCHILSFLSTKKAVSTSILSTRWRYLFASVPILDLDDRPFFSLPERNRYKTITEVFNFVDRVLLFQTATYLEKLRLIITKDISHVCSWISVAATLCSVRQVDLCIFNTNQRDIKLPDVLFTCKALVVLKLNILTALYVPSEVCLPNLKTLHLEYVGFLNDSIQRLISNCIILEDFFIRGCGSNISQFNICHPFLKRLKIGPTVLSNTRIVIDAPSLVYLEYHATIAARNSLWNLHSLVKAKIRLFQCRDDMQTSEILSANELFRRITNVKSLELSNALTHFLCQEPSPLFDKLIELKIDRYFVRHHDKGILDLLQSMPNLEKLCFPHEVFGKLSEIVPSCLLHHLKTIEISSFHGDLLENFKYFLKNTSVLEKLIIHAHCHYEKEKLKIAKELLASPRKSKKCIILVI